MYTHGHGLFPDHISSYKGVAHTCHMKSAQIRTWQRSINHLYPYVCAQSAPALRQEDEPINTHQLQYVNVSMQLHSS